MGGGNRTLSIPGGRECYTHYLWGEENGTHTVPGGGKGNTLLMGEEKMVHTLFLRVGNGPHTISAGREWYTHYFCG